MQAGPDTTKKVNLFKAMCPSFVWWIGLPCKDAGSRVPEELVGCMQVGVDITIFKKERGYPIPSSLNS